MKEVAPTVKQVIESLRSSGAQRQADAVQTVLDYAMYGGEPNVAIPIDWALHLRASEASENLTADVLEGWEKFLAGEWEPVKPTFAKHGEGKAKSVMNIRPPRDLVKRVEEAADRYVAEHDWPTIRGHKLNARHLATQWLARKYPDPDDDKQQAAE